MFLIDLVKDAWQLHKYNKIIKTVFENEDIVSNMNEIFGLDLRRAWFGRIYTVINPLVKNDKLDYDSLVLEIQDGQVNADEFMNKVCIEMLIKMKAYVIENELFDILTYKLTRLDKYGNYLFTLQPVPYESFVNNLKKTLKFLGVTSILLVAGLIAFLCFV